MDDIVSCVPLGAAMCAAQNVPTQQKLTEDMYLLFIYLFIFDLLRRSAQSEHD